jgi:hypothetical protein
MRGAALFLITFLLVVPNARAPIEALWSETTGRIASEYPFSYFLLVVMLSASITSSLIMWLWPHTKESGQPAQVLLRIHPAEHTRRRGRLRAFVARVRGRVVRLLHRKESLIARTARRHFHSQAADI